MKEFVINIIIYEIQNNNEFILEKLNKGEDLILKNDDCIYQITSPINQKNNDNPDISTIILGDNEQKLKDKYNIGKDDSLIIVKIDHYEKGLLIPIVDYEIFNPITKEKLNLSDCNDVEIEILYPAKVDENELFKYNMSSEYYNDLCYTYTTNDGTDITLSDRKINK